jgi:16S rRNA (guanine966-N2)-methyltransferase
VARVIAGEAGGRRLAVPDGRDTRPTSDRAREGLFATVSSIVGSLAGARVLDLYAGSGAVGLEALSRGAEHVLLVEHGGRAAGVIRQNIEAIGLPGAAVVADRVERVLARGPARAGTTWCSPTRPTHWPTRR